MPSRKADPFHWDGLVRLTHWGGGHLHRQPLAQRGRGRVARAAGIRRHGADRPAPAVGGSPSHRAATPACVPLIPSRDDFRQQAEALRTRAPRPRPSRQWQAGGLGPLAAGAGHRR